MLLLTLITSKLKSLIIAAVGYYGFSNNNDGPSYLVTRAFGDSMWNSEKPLINKRLMEKSEIKITHVQYTFKNKHIKYTFYTDKI